MDLWVIAALIVILASLVYSVWKQVAFSIIASAACVAVLIISILAQTYGSVGSDELAFMPHDLADPARSYTLLTSMFMHAGFTHLFFNLIVLVFVGFVFEQRIGTRPFIILYIVAGLLGTLAFAALRWNEPFISVVGASGAIMGVLGAFARLYPNEKMIFFFIPIPVSIWTIVLIIVLMQMLFVITEAGVAVESHLAGLAAGIVLAPYIVRLPLHQKSRMPSRVARTVRMDKLRKLATTPQLKGIADRIEHEEIPEVQSAWIDQFISNARCPQCGSRLRVEKDSIICEKGHIQ